MAVECPLDAILPVPAGAFAFAVFALPSIAKHVPPILACQRRGARPLAGMDDSAPYISETEGVSKDAEQYDTPTVGRIWRGPLVALQGIGPPNLAHPPNKRQAVLADRHGRLR